jgi:hypothetical protein
VSATGDGLHMALTTEDRAPLDVFCSYSHKDERRREELEAHMSSLRREGLIREWSDRQISAGVDWAAEIDERINTAQIILLLVSPDFIQSEYCYGVELARALAQHDAGHARVIPIIVRPVDWQSAQIGKLQALPRNGKPITRWSNRDDAYLDVVKSLRQVINEMRAGPASPSRVPSEVLPPTPPEIANQTESARKALEALGHLMEDPEVREQVAVFESDFAAACEQIALIVDYKELHDLLHELVFAYNMLPYEAESLARDSTAWSAVNLFEMKLQSACENASAIAARSQIPKSETSWVRDLAEADQLLVQAVNETDGRRVYMAMRLLKRVFDLIPSYINTRLNGAARAFRLSALVGTLRRVHEAIPRFHLDPEDVRRFAKGIDDLAEVSASLNLSVEEHHTWQELDGELKVFEDTVEGDRWDLEWFWTRFKQKAEPLYTSREEQWALALAARGRTLDARIQANDSAGIKEAFRMYRSQADMHFYLVDKNLKELCGRLRTVGDELGKVLDRLA